MARRFSLFLALRYLQPKRTFVSVITLISVLGVTLGITVLILVISVMTGFDRELQRKVLGFEAHVVIATEALIENWREVADFAGAAEHVVAVAPFVQGPVIVEFEQRRLAPKIRGIDPARELAVVDLARCIVDGTFDLGGDKTVVGSELARSLGLAVGDKLTVYSPGNLKAILDGLEEAEGKPADDRKLSELRELVLPTELEVTGIFESGRFLYDSEFLLVPLHVGQELYGLGDAVHGLTVRTSDPYAAGSVKQIINTRLQAPAQALTWMDLNREMFDAIRMERNVMFFLLLFIVVVAAFGIMNTLITVTVQKTREIGILKALGATTGQIVWVFLVQGMVVGAIGGVTGLGAGMWLVRFRNEAKDFLGRALGIEIFPADVYQFSAIPAEVVPKDVAIICLSAFAICSVAAQLPAWFAARLDQLKALRSEN
jgi:lipoprotein-releasing system permease protein